MNANVEPRAAEFDNLQDETQKGPHDVNLDVILDVPVTLSMEVGRTRIPIRNLLLILENLADGARVSKDVDFLTERVRASMARHISAEYTENGVLSVITVDPRLETLLGEAARRGEDAYALLDPNTVAKIYGSLTKQIQHAQQGGLQPIVLTSPQTRLALKRLTERAAPQLVVLSYSEIAAGLRVESIGQISTTDDSVEPVGV